jgi:HNH endonuclease
MGMRPARMCKKCHNTAEQGTNTCPAHRNADRDSDKARRDAQPVPHNRNSKAWLQTRSLTLFRYPQCAQLDGNGLRCTQLATEAHHVIRWPDWIKQGGDYLDQSNLVGLCRACHTKHTVAERQSAVVPGSFAPPDDEWSPVI